MKRIRFKSEKGIAGADGLVAVFIITLFAGLITALTYNIYISNASLKRMSTATDYIIDVFEYVDKSFYDDVTEQNVIAYFNNKYYYENGNSVRRNAQVKMDTSIENMDTPYKAMIDITKYSDEENVDLDLVEEIEMWVTYKLGSKTQTINMKTIKKREMLETPNKPDINLVNKTSEQNIYAIKNENSSWIVCSFDDDNWYNYGNNELPKIILTTSEYDTNDVIDINQENVYIWIPRYAYDQTNDELLYLYSNTNNYLEETNGINIIEELTGNYTVPSDFTLNQEELTGIWTDDDTSSIYLTLYNHFHQ